MITDQQFQATIEAQFLMGHRLPATCLEADRRTIRGWTWEEDEVRQALHVPLDDTWHERVMLLESEHLTSFCFFAAPDTVDEDGTVRVDERWRDDPREDWGTLGILPEGVLRVAQLYGRPYVRWHESPALLANWRLISAEADARGQQPFDRERWAREWPEQALLHQARWGTDAGSPPA